MSRPLLAVLLCTTTLLSVFAGCVQDPTPEATEPTLPPLPAGNGTADVHLPGALPANLTSGLIPPVPLLRPLGHTALEPTLGVTSKGTIFYAAVDTTAETLHTDVMRSTDNGTTWKNVSPVVGGQQYPPTTSDPYLYVDPVTDRVYNYDMFPILTCGTISFSDDEGETWTNSPVGCGTAPPYDHQTLAAGTPRVVQTVGYSRVVYYCVNRVSDSICGRSLDGGMTFSSGTPAFLGADPNAGGDPDPTDPLAKFCGGLHGHLGVAPDGTVYLPREYCGRPYVAISRNDGTTWEQVMVSSLAALRNGPDPNVAVDAAGNVYYLFVDEVGLLQLTISKDAGKTWSEAKVVSAPDVDATHLPAIAAGDAGKIAFVYTGTENQPGGYKDPKPKDVENAHWHGYLAVATDALNESYVIQTVKVNPEKDPLVIGPCGPGRCPGMYDFIDVVLGPEGRPYGAFVDACNDKCESRSESSNEDAVVALLASGPRLIGSGELSLVP